MSNFIYSPNDTFLARCWWQGSQRINVDAWEQVKHQLAAVWVQTGGRHARDSHDRYLQCEAQGRWVKNLEPNLYTAPTLQFWELFWFGAYTRGTPTDDKPRYYEIRPADRVGSIGAWTLDYSASKASGYAGIWQASHVRGAELAPEARLWTIDGMPRLGPTSGQRRYNMRLLVPGGKPLRRHERDSAIFLNVHQGEEGMVAMQIISKPHVTSQS